MGEKQKYFTMLSEGTLNTTKIDRIWRYMIKNSCRNSAIPISKANEESEEIKKLIRDSKTQGFMLPLQIYRGNKDWQGLVVGFPGTKDDLRTENVGTPQLRLVLYPILEICKQLNEDNNGNMPCLYLIGAHFNDVFLRKFEFLKALVQHAIILTEDLLNCSETKQVNSSVRKEYEKDIKNERYYQISLIDQMKTKGWIDVPIDENENIRLGYISHEVPTVEGTEEPERLDILGYDIDDKSLVAFEIKGPKAQKRQLKNLFFQGLEHRDWLERNKMAVKFLFRGKGGENINTKKRVKLVLGFCHGEVPDLFYDLRRSKVRKDPDYLKIAFCYLSEVAKVGEQVKVLRYEG